MSPFTMFSTATQILKQKVDVDMLNTINNVLADVLSFVQLL